MSQRAIGVSYRSALRSLVVFVVATASAAGQTRYDQPRRGDRRERAEGEHRPERERDRDAAHDAERYYDDRDIDYDSAPPYDYYERHWRRQARDYTRARGRFDRRSRWGHYRPGWRYYDDGPYHYYGHGYGNGYGYRGFDGGYWEGRRDGRRFAEWERRNELGRRSYTDAMSEGLLAFRSGEYSTAARSFIRAAKINQGDPASRIHAAHALVAIGRYREALPALRRAFQLQSKIAYLALDIRRDYGLKADFDAHLKGVANAAREAEDDPALWLLLGYYQFFSGRESNALESFTKADQLAPGDFMTEALLQAARMVAPAAGERPSSERGRNVTPGPHGETKAQRPRDV